jgi:Rieske Fe-S protein
MVSHLGCFPLLKTSIVSDYTLSLVAIVRDKWSCAHIDAHNENNVWFVQGLCHGSLFITLL